MSVQAQPQPRPKTVIERIPYPSSSLLRFLFKFPILLWRLGFGPVIGQIFMLITTTGRKSGLPRRTVIEYHEAEGRKYIMVAWENADWYRNILANPLITIQTASGTESVLARELTDDERGHAYDLMQGSRYFRVLEALIGFDLTREEFIRARDRFRLLTFDPTDQPTPPPLEADLRWVWPLLAAGLFAGRLLFRRRR